MPRQENVPALVHEQPPAASPASPIDFPVREYIGAMARELARMARWDRDEGLAALLDAAGERAGGNARRLTASAAVGRRQAVASGPNDPVGASPARR